MNEHGSVVCGAQLCKMRKAGAALFVVNTLTGAKLGQPPTKRLDGGSMTSPRVSISKRWVIVLLLPLVTLCGLWVYVFLSTRPPKEARLLKAFYAHRADTERLRDMLLADDQVRAVYVRSGVETTNSGLPHNPSEVNFPVSRYSEYRALLEQAGATEVFRAGEGNSEICIAVWASGFGGDTRHVNICCMDRAPANQVASLDDFYKTPKPRHPVFRHIDANWYLEADW
jgi:hypothetical protein